MTPTDAETATHHLAWICRAPQLLSAGTSFDLSAYLPADAFSRLRQWQEHPDMRPAVLDEPANPRLGHYFERLYQCLLTDLLRWQLLASNVQVRDDQGRTIGELDFLVRNPSTGNVEHHEVAVKFYLGYPARAGGGTLWYGPNSQDRLDLKSRRLLDHQSRLTGRPETRALLMDLGIHGPVVPRIFMPGYLFYPSGAVVSLPDTVPRNHLRGHWLYHHDTGAMDTRHWVPLRKPHWLGPWWQAQPPDESASAAALASVKEQYRPRLFAALEHSPKTGLWQETARTFVVPARWPDGSPAPR
ncbi:hypothetical protein SAMN05216203_3101 [Marinobacter daqiaonensis]|uniref:DUF1853 domain-containing protein n=1 Tax=Marinobacter daqiaonensis TaxID=650891 RepID=A0A1I6JNX0_9GAMM|nr:DUF1853 family protein [Marinobacter daqiaonensis]SFR80657.1 hypothetical protein SAMN05216203_3101 [Marinobacter daqiaonensis]